MTELTLCIAGPWADRQDFMRQVITHPPEGRYMYLGGILADAKAKQHVKLAHGARDPDLVEAFRMAGRGLDDAALAAIDAHASVVYLQVPTPFDAQLEILRKFCGMLRDIGGFALKVESSGVAHTMDGWLELLDGSGFDLYRSVVTLVGGEREYYSCGMHVFDLPDCAVPRSLSAEIAADLMNRFNYYCFAEKPELADGHTFSLAPDAPYYRLRCVKDMRHDAEDLFHNPQGLWFLSPLQQQ